MFSALLITLPTQPNAVRLRLWRALKALGCAALRDGAYVLPQAKAALFDAVAEEARAHGGAATVWQLAPVNEAQQRDTMALFNRSAAYAEWLGDVRALTEALPTLGETEARRRGRALAEALQAVQAIDFYPSAAAAQAEVELRQIRQALEQHFARGEPTAKRLRGVAEAVEPLSSGEARRFRGRRWATRARPWVDRLACAWLIRRFIDPEAHFLWLADPAGATPPPRGAIGFDFDGARFSHVRTAKATLVTFEVLAASFGLLRTDARLARVARVVHFLDEGGIPVPEAPGLEAVLGGLREVHADDDALSEAAALVFDALHAAPMEAP